MNKLILFIKPNPERILYSAMFSVLMIGMIQSVYIAYFAIMLVLPLIPLVIAIPLIVLVPEFTQTGSHVEYWFFGLMLKSPIAYATFFIYYFIIAYMILFKIGKK